MGNNEKIWREVIRGRKETLGRDKLEGGKNERD